MASNVRRSTTGQTAEIKIVRQLHGQFANFLLAKGPDHRRPVCAELRRPSPRIRRSYRSGGGAGRTDGSDVGPPRHACGGPEAHQWRKVFLPRHLEALSCLGAEISAARCALVKSCPFRRGLPRAVASPAHGPTERAAEGWGDLRRDAYLAPAACVVMVCRLVRPSVSSDRPATRI